MSAPLRQAPMERGKLRVAEAAPVVPRPRSKRGDCSRGLLRMRTAFRSSAVLRLVGSSGGSSVATPPAYASSAVSSGGGLVQSDCVQKSQASVADTHPVVDRRQFGADTPPATQWRIEPRRQSGLLLQKLPVRNQPGSYGSMGGYAAPINRAHRCTRCSVIVRASDGIAPIIVPAQSVAHGIGSSGTITDSGQRTVQGDIIENDAPSTAFRHRRGDASTAVRATNLANRPR